MIMDAKMQHAAKHCTVNQKHKVCMLHEVPPWSLNCRRQALRTARYLLLIVNRLEKKEREQ